MGKRFRTPEADTAAQAAPGRWTPASRDVAHAVAVAALAGGFAGASAASWGMGAPLVTAALVAAEAVPLVWRRRAPVVVLAVTLALAYGNTLLPAVAVTIFAPALVATYTLGTLRRWPVTAVAAGLAAGGSPLLLHGVLGEHFPFHISVLPPAEGLANFLAGSLVAFGLAAGLGVLVGAWRVRTARLEEYAARVERDRAERERRAVLEERARIARELHDVAAHHLSGLVLQAGALERTAARESEPIRQLAAEVRQGGATALGSMRRLVGLLRAVDEETTGRGSQPSLADLDGLVQAARRDGLAVDLATNGLAEQSDGGVPDEVGLATYRIVQEALSNTRRHAPGAHAEARLTRDDQELTVEVTDDGGSGPAPPDDAGEPGHGLIGMRERVALLDGTLEAGPRSPTGWRVRARLPLATDHEEPT